MAEAVRTNESGFDELIVDGLPYDAASVDFCFDGRRIWSVDLRGRQGERRSTFPIPSALTPYLEGTTTLTVMDSGTGEIFHESELSFGSSDARIDVSDSEGVPLSLNKWGRLSKTLDRFSDQHGLILDRAQELIGLLQGWGYAPFVVGGTLLGAVRDGALLPHDDDADIAYLSRHTNPVDVAREHFDLSRRFTSLGYRIVQHSGAHMQLHFEDGPSATNYYIDIFAAFFTDDGNINQPFHVRGQMAESQLLPFSEVAIGNYRFPAPADVDRWLTINYDKDWRTPIPGYKLRTKHRTQRRFQNWFGSFNFKRDFWTDFYAESGDERLEDESTWAQSAQWIVENQELFTSPILLELGSGNSGLAEQLRTPSRRVVASDYLSSSAIQRPEAENQDDFVHLNLLRLNILDAQAVAGFQGSFDIVANHVFEQTSHFARHNALHLIHMSCTKGGTAVATLFARPAANVAFKDPTSWHLHPRDLAEEAQSYGLLVRTVPLPAGSSDDELRAPYAAIFSLAPSEGSHQEPDDRFVPHEKFPRIRSKFRDWVEQRDQAHVLDLQLRRLESQLDNRRRDLLRVAEATDLIAKHQKNVSESSERETMEQK